MKVAQMLNMVILGSNYVLSLDSNYLPLSWIIICFFSHLLLAEVNCSSYYYC